MPVSNSTDNVDFLLPNENSVWMPIKGAITHSFPLEKVNAFEFPDLKTDSMMTRQTKFDNFFQAAIKPDHSHRYV